MAGRQPQERPEKILVAMHKLSGGTTRPLKYEDIVVRAFRLFPDDFALRGYPQYPDSSDLHKPLYGPLKRSGYVRAANKQFSLTARGIEEAARLVGVAADKIAPLRNGHRIPRDLQVEADRMFGSAAFEFCRDGKDDKVLDTDFYVFLGVTVRTPPNDFAGRMTRVEEVVEAAKLASYPTREFAKALASAWTALKRRFAKHIEKRTETKKRERR